eukprot:1239449-Prorocentrum_lima.AAC.1
MTSSLVGSEMCIRDRRGCVRRRSILNAGAASAALCTGHPLRQRLMLSRPVSYTHLTLPTICSV